MVDRLPEKQQSNTLINLFFKLVDSMNGLVKLLGGIIICAMSVAVFASVVSRYFANISLTWVEEAATFGMAWLCTLGAGLATRHGDMTMVSIGVMYLPEKAQKFFTILSCLLSLVIFAFIIDSGINMAIVAKLQRSVAIPSLTMFWVYIALPIGLIIMFINTIARMTEIFMGREVKKA